MIKDVLSEEEYTNNVVECKYCDGSGRQPIGPLHKGYIGYRAPDCIHCNGTGKLEYIEDSKTYIAWTPPEVKARLEQVSQEIFEKYKADFFKKFGKKWDDCSHEERTTLGKKAGWLDDDY